MKTPFERARAYVSKIPGAIQHSEGDHQTFIAACKVVAFGLSDADSMEVMREYNQRCQPPWKEKDLARKLRNAARLGGKKFSDVPTTDKDRWPKPQQNLRSKVLSTGYGLADLTDASPMESASDGSFTRHYLNILFPGDPLVCCGMTSFRFWTRHISEFGSPDRYQFIVPSPMSKPLGMIQDCDPDAPKLSAHSIDNTGVRKYAVVEFDKGAVDEHACLISHLRQYAPLAMAVHSGGKSLHGWFRVEGEPEESVKKFYRYAVALGADRATSTKSQFVRMPDGIRDNGKRQVVFYFDPEVCE